MREETVITAMTSPDFITKQRELAEKGWRVIPGTVIIAAVWDEKARIDRWQYVAFFSREKSAGKLCDGWRIGAHHYSDSTTGVEGVSSGFARAYHFCAECVARFKEDMQSID